MRAGTEGDVAAVRMMMDRLEVSVEDLAAERETVASAVTFGDYIPRVLESIPGGRTREHLHTYWRKILAQPGWSDKRLDEPTTQDLADLCEAIRRARLIRRNDRGGHDVVRHVVEALRRLYRHAEDNKVLDPRDNPTTRLRRPRQRRGQRRALQEPRLAELIRVAASTGRDPELDNLLLRLHIETACRRGGALALRPMDLDPGQSLVLFREKGDTYFWHPVSPTLMKALLGHARRRGAPHDGQLLRNRRGRPITRRHYDGLFVRVGRHLPWVRQHGISIHWLRHTTTTWVERHFGTAVAAAYARHSVTGNGVTALYTVATIEEVAVALSYMTGEPHPLAGDPPRPDEPLVPTDLDDVR
ncbi:tyrosine-type recombinase/integrase [Nocardia takedensis]|uniref:tyrosine-type recombinase/integrase n=1 Tax=Nocardia takedensis TaxID=259390 RepID=UPI0002D3F12A|nr:site-specific integrase [Nocardia takedensis]